MKKKLKGVICNIRFLIQNKKEASVIVTHWKNQPIKILTISTEEFL